MTSSRSPLSALGLAKLSRSKLRLSEPSLILLCRLELRPFWRCFSVLGLFMLCIAAEAAPRTREPAAAAFLRQSVLTATAAGEIEARCDAAIQLVGKERKALEIRKGRASMRSDFQAFDTLSLVLGDASSEMGLVLQTAPAKQVREAAEACTQRLSDLGTQVSLSRPIYDRLSAIPAVGLDRRAAYALRKQLIGYRLGGVDRDVAVRAKVQALQQQITETGIAFDANIRNDKGDIALAPEDLEGLPQDYRDRHGPGADGVVHLSFDYPDVFPVLDFADRRETRRKVLTAFSNRAWPANDAVLKRLLEQRYQLATTLGYPDYAAYITADKMIGTKDRAATFLDEVNRAAQPGASAEQAELLAFARTVDPSIDRLERWDNSYMANKLRQSKYDVGAAEVRRYFTLEKARAGIFGLVRDLFGTEIRPWQTPVWSPDVTAWELYDGKTLVGRIYLDLSPRVGKYNHAAQFPIRTGVRGVQVPMGALVTNFPATGPMDHDDVTTFLHEFGHLLHNMYSGRVDYAAQSMGTLQWDFIEAPSQLLEEWAWDADTLLRFASDEQGTPIPRALVAKMNAGRHFGEPTRWKGQLANAAVSLNFYNRAPDFDLKAMADSQYARYSMFPVQPEAHSYDNFGHLNGYSAIYYTYVWSKAIALDLHTRFEAGGARDPAIARRYRKLVLDPGGSEDANDLVRHYLGRPFRLDAFERRLQER